ncbi:60S ribosomal protein L6E [Gracilaria domingensis]|nr:60S ribosomal protein L6E [Gracilaria domingensis]
MLAGRLRGSRVICLGQLPSGKLLVTGPYSINRIPLRRVDQAYVIATSTALDVSAVDISKFDDAYFKRVKSKSKADVMETDEGESKYSPTEERIADQKVVDQVLLPIIEKEPMMSSYLKSRFSLKRGMFPHEMHF